MNIQNISELAEHLQSIGFENAGYLLLKRICFKPDSFSLLQKVEKGKDQLSFRLFFEKDGKQNVYVLMYYDAILQKVNLVETTINGINTFNLEKSMTEIDWKSAFDINTKRQCNLEDKATWEKEQKLESVIENLIELEKSEEGKVISVGLKLKYWAGIPYQELFGNISPLKSKSEVSQRFYFFEGQTGISADEAYRFLQNKWLEKQMQTKRKQTGDSQVGETENDSQASSGNSLLRKKRLNNIKGTKENKSIKN